MTLDNGTDGQTDGQTDRRIDRVRRNMRPPPREEGRIIRGRVDERLRTGGRGGTGEGEGGEGRGWIGLKKEGREGERELSFSSYLRQCHAVGISVTTL